MVVRFSVEQQAPGQLFAGGTNMRWDFEQLVEDEDDAERFGADAFRLMQAIPRGTIEASGAG